MKPRPPYPTDLSDKKMGSELLADVIKTVGTAALVVAAAAWLTKAIITHILSRKVEVYKSELKRESDQEAERVKSNLQIVALERQIVFSKLHEKRGLIRDLFHPP